MTRIGLRRQARDGLDRLYLTWSRREDLPPYTLRCHVGPVEEYEQTPAEFTTYFKLLAGLHMDERVLDIGCGTGRFAQQLLGRPNFFTGVYRGFDIDRRSIEWARHHVRADAADVHFTDVDVYNKHYNPEGHLHPESFTFPYGDASFDFAFAVSLFTHLPGDACARYLQEIGRVLVPGGRALLSFVLLPERTDRLAPLAVERLHHGVLEANGLAASATAGLLHHLDGYSTLTPETPEIVTLHRHETVTAQARGAGLDVTAVHPGTWNDADGGPAFQDLVLLTKPTVPTARSES
jgi:SAM-dependent methyltransferase